MEEISDRHISALKWLGKANEDLSKAIQFALDRKYFQAYGSATRVQESIRQLLEVDKDLTLQDKDE